MITQPHRSLQLPEGYQSFDYCLEDSGYPSSGTLLDDPDGLKKALASMPPSDTYLYTQHQIFYEDDVLKQTRSSPNWEGGVVTYATCKHNMRNYTRNTWRRVWIAGLCPVQCAQNCLLFAGVVKEQFASNYLLNKYMRSHHPEAYKVKRATGNPRGDLYSSRRILVPADTREHTNYIAPKQHTRSVEFYDKSPGSVSTRDDGKIPKWWRDIEYVQSKAGKAHYPPCFILDPCWVFSQPLLWTSYQPKRATLKLDNHRLASSLR